MAVLLVLLSINIVCRYSTSVTYKRGTIHIFIISPLMSKRTSAFSFRCKSFRRTEGSYAALIKLSLENSQRSKLCMLAVQSSGTTADTIATTAIKHDQLFLCNSHRMRTLCDTFLATTWEYTTVEIWMTPLERRTKASPTTEGVTNWNCSDTFDNSPDQLLCVKITLSIETIRPVK